jgi:hypothetical protein
VAEVEDVPARTARRYRAIARHWDYMIFPHLAPADDWHAVTQSACLRLLTRDVNVVDDGVVHEA